MESTTVLKEKENINVSSDKNNYPEDSNRGVFTWFKDLLARLQFYRLGVMGFILMVQANVIVPATILAVLYNSQSTIQFLLITIFSFGVLVTNLAERPTRETVPLFLVSTLTHFVIIVVNVI